MSTSKKPWFESLGYTKSHIEAIESAKTCNASVQISGVETTVKRANVKKVVADLATGVKPIEDCGQEE